MKERHLWIVGFCIMKKIEYQKGEKIGDCIYLNEVIIKKNIRHALFRCQCGNTFRNRSADLKNHHTTSCGCVQIEIARKSNSIHKLSKHRVYKSWTLMKDRCLNINGHDYLYYGNRGITIYNEWKTNFKAYFDYVMSLENAMRPNLTIDRIRNNEGYRPGNLRWATKHIQAVNQRMNKSNISGYTGIRQDQQPGKWRSEITVNGKRIWLGYYDLITDAVNARNQYIITNRLTEYKLQ